MELGILYAREIAGESVCKKDSTCMQERAQARVYAIEIAPACKRDSRRHSGYCRLLSLLHTGSVYAAN